ncbi:YybH family protein [Pseudomonas knackmussii]|uniref:YybH family protein n=1 Tax=Pseudomonas knackmussii TaxID=65741 RepID=UPI003F4A3FB9
MSPHSVTQAIEQADRLINARQFDPLMDFYTDDATLVLRPGLSVCGKAQIRRAFDAIDLYFHGCLHVRQAAMEVLEAGDTALVLARTLVAGETEEGPQVQARKATYVFRREADGQWRCAVDNSYGSDLLDGAPTGSRTRGMTA